MLEFANLHARTHSNYVLCSGDAGQFAGRTDQWLAVLSPQGNKKVSGSSAERSVFRWVSQNILKIKKK